MFLPILQRMVGLPMTCACHAMNLAMFDFGKDRTVTTRTGWTYFSDIALHVQCAWRILDGDRIIAGSGDYYCANEKGELIDRSQDDPDTLLTLRMRLLANTRLVVSAASLLPGCGLLLGFENGFRLEVLPTCSANSREVESWRLIEGAHPNRHFVATAAGGYIRACE